MADRHSNVDQKSSLTAATAALMMLDLNQKAGTAKEGEMPDIAKNMLNMCREATQRIQNHPNGLAFNEDRDYVFKLSIQVHSASSPGLLPGTIQMHGLSACMHACTLIQQAPALSIMPECRYI